LLQRYPRSPLGAAAARAESTSRWYSPPVVELARLVNQDSGTDDRDDVNKAGALLVEWLEQLGFDVARHSQERFGDHLLGVKRGSGAKRILFVGHYDTVFPAGTARQRPFRIADGRAYGRGRIASSGSWRPPVARSVSPWAGSRPERWAAEFAIA